MIGIPNLALALFLSLDSLRLAQAEAELSVQIGIEELRAHVYRLASPEFMGRRGAGAARAGRYLVEAFERLHLAPAFGNSYSQPIPWLLADDDHKANSFVGRNVGAMLPGTDPELKDEWILLCAHYDHLGQKGDEYYPGADDNASGIAMLLEVAERFALQQDKPRRTILFVAFDQEETGLLGSAHFAAHPPRDFNRLKAVLTADMLGRSMLGLMDEYVFALGSETAPRLRELLEEVRPPGGLKVGRIGADLIGTRSDYGPFRDRRIPFLFFSTGQHADYHRPTDLPGRLDYRKLRDISVWINDLLWRLANADEAPTWEAHGLPPDLDEVQTILTLVNRALSRPELIPLTSRQHETVVEIRERLVGIVARGRVTEAERTWLLWTARLLMATVF